MNKLAEKVQEDLLRAIDNDDLVLPTLPEVALKIRQAAENPEISVASLTRVIGSDAALSARLIKVVNSPLLRAAQEATNLHTAINRLGINYSSNLAIGLVMEQIFHARSSVIELKMREVWQRSLQIAGVCQVLCRQFTSLKPDQAALGGLVHQIGVLPILTYAEDHYELLSDPVCLDHVIDSIHPRLGTKLLTVWEFPDRLANLPGEYLNLERAEGAVDYVDLVQIARVFCQRGEDPSLALGHLPAFRKLGLDPFDSRLLEQLEEARYLFS